MLEIPLNGKQCMMKDGEEEKNESCFQISTFYL